MPVAGQWVGFLFVLGANFFWGLNFVLAKVMATSVPPVALAFWRWTVAILILAPVLPAAWRLRGQLLRHWEFYLVAAITGVVSYHVSIYIAAHTSSAYTLPLIAAFSGVFVKVGYLLQGRGITLVQACGGLLAVGGLLVLLGRGDLEALLGFKFVTGDLWMIFGALVWAIYSLALERKPQGQPFANHLTIILVGLPMLGLLYGVEYSYSGPFVVDAKVAWVLAYLALFPSVACYWLWMGAIDRLGAVRTHALYYTLPLFSAFQAWLILGERLYWYHAVAAVAIIVGAILTTLRGRGQKQA